MPDTLVVQLARLGDLVQTRRLVLSLAPARVHLAVDASLAGLARRMFPHAVVHPLASHAGDMDQQRVLTANRKAFAELAAQDFQTVYNLNHSGLNLAVSRLFDPAIVRGHRCSGGQPLKDSWTDLAFRWVRRRGVLGLNLVDMWAHLAPRPAAPESVNPPAVPAGGGLGVVLAGRNARRSLPPPVLAGIVQALAARFPDRPVHLLGTAAERPQAKALLGALKPPALARTRDLCGATSLDDLLEVLSGLDLVLTPDTGSMHLAAWLGTPVMAIFLSSAWAWETGPYGLGHTVWQAAAPCAPCLESAACHQGVACLKPFGAVDFLRLLSGRTDVRLPGLAGFASGLDPLGAVCNPIYGQDAVSADLPRFRSFLMRHLGLGGQPPQADMAEALYQERDWQAPPPIARQHV